MSKILTRKKEGKGFRLGQVFHLKATWPCAADGKGKIQEGENGAEQTSQRTVTGRVGVRASE